MLKNNRQIRTSGWRGWKAAAIWMIMILFLGTQARFVPAEEKAYDSLSVDNYEETFSVTSCSLKAMHVEEVTFSHADTYFDELLVEDGQYVEKGQVLVTFTVQRNQSTLEQARLSLRRKKQQYILRLIQLREEIREAREEADQMGSSLEKELASLEVDRLEISLQQYINEQKYSIYLDETKLKQLEEEYEESQLVAPISGIVFLGGAQKYNQGDPVTSLTMKIADPQSVRIVLDNNVQFHYGMEVSIEYGSGKNVKTYKGVIRAAENLLPTLDVSLKGTIPENSAEAPVIIEPLDTEMDLADLYIEMYNHPNSSWGVTFEATVRTKYLENVLILNPKNAFLENGEYSVQILDGDSLRKQKIIYGVWNRRAIWVLGGIDLQTQLAKK